MSSLRLGWKEYADLPDLGLLRLKVKMDTGARTSALHVERFSLDDSTVSMTLLPHRRSEPIEATAPLFAMLDVRNSGGELRRRPVIETTVRLGDVERTIPVTLANRRGMLFRMLIGRKALEAFDASVDAQAKYLLGRRALRP